MKKINVPSFEFERKTQAFNKYIISPIALITIFSYTFFVLIFHLFLCSLFNVISTMLLDSIILSIIPIIFLIILVFVKIFPFLNSLLYSYKFEENKIIKGKILSGAITNLNDLAIEATLLSYMFDHIGQREYRTGKATLSLFRILNLISINMNKELVEKLFDTEVYKKRVFINPKLIKEKKYTLHYLCDNNKKLVIPKIYEGMDVNYSKKNTSFISRIVVGSFILWFFLFSFSMIDLLIGIQKNPVYKTNIVATCSEITNQLDLFDYAKVHKSSNISHNCSFEKKVISKENDSYKYSSIRYGMDKNGNIVDLNLDLFYNQSNYNRNELKYILKSTFINLTEEEINSFIEKVNECLDTNYCSYNTKLTNKDFIVSFDRSNNFIHVHTI